MMGVGAFAAPAFPVMLAASMPAAPNPTDPELLAWLASLGPRAELAARFALRGHFPEVRAERAFAERIVELFARRAAGFWLFRADYKRTSSPTQHLCFYQLTR